LKLEDNQDYEVIGGRLILVPKPMPYHQEIVGRLITELNIFLRQSSMGKVYSDRKQKSQLYHTSGVKEYWIIDPALQLVEVFISGENEWNRSGIYDETDLLTSPLLPGLLIELKNIF
jgi:Uma2 family endonuclease